jgi:flagellar biosynthesis/type III secretory pathway protein FliH
VPAADGAFVPLAQHLRGEAARDDVAPAAVVCAAPAEPEPARVPELADLVRDVRIFRARLEDALAVSCDALLREFAYAVLGRELILAPPDIAVIAARVLAAHSDVHPLRLRVAPGDVAALARCDDALPPVASDVELAPGDAILEFDGGCADARLGVRLAAILECAE